MLSTMNHQPEEVEREPEEDPKMFLVESSRSFKSVVQKNNHEVQMLARKSQHIDNMRRNRETEINRQEKEVRGHLHRLHQEERIIEMERLQDDLWIDDVMDSNFPDVELEPKEVVNPYPITIISRTSSSPPKTHDRDRLTDGKRKMHQQLPCQSSEFEDVDMHFSSGRILPPLRSSSSRKLPNASSSTLGLQRADSVSSMGNNSPVDKEKEFWIGDPEAIQSVRRPRKTVAQQRLDNAMCRSNSLKERSITKSGSAVSRSHSLREPARRQYSDSPSESRVWSRSNSLKENRQHLMKSVENVNEAFGNMELNTPRRASSWKLHRPNSHTGPGVSRGSSVISLRELSASAESRSAVWGHPVHSEHFAGSPNFTESSFLGVTGRRQVPGTASLPPISPTHTLHNTPRHSPVEVHIEPAGGPIIKEPLGPLIRRSSAKKKQTLRT